MINKAIFDNFPVLESERLIFRAFQKEDAQDFFKTRSDKEVMKYMDTSPLKDEAAAEDIITSIQKSFDDKKGIQWAIVEKATNQWVGYFGIWRLIEAHARGEIGYALQKTAWGKGYMTETLHQLIPYGFNTLNLHSMEANMNPNNSASKRLLVNFGFQQEAHFRENYYFNGVFYDSLIFSLLKSDLERKA